MTDIDAGAPRCDLTLRIGQAKSQQRPHRESGGRRPPLPELKRPPNLHFGGLAAWIRLPVTVELASTIRERLRGVLVDARLQWA